MGRGRGAREGSSVLQQQSVSMPSLVTPGATVASPGPEPGVEALVSTTGGLPVILPLGKRVAAPHPGAPPGLPGVDAHIPREELTYDFLRNVVRHQRWHVREVVEEAAEEEERVDYDDESAASNQSHGISLGQIHRCCKFIDVTFGDGDGEVSMVELENAFRRMRRERAAVRLRERGRALTRRLVILIRRRDMDVERFMHAIDLSQGGQGDGKLTPVELERGIKKFVDSEQRLVSMESIGSVNDPDGPGSNSRHTVQALHHREMKERAKKDIEALIEAEQHAILDDTFGISDATSANLRGELKFGNQDITDLIRFLDPNADGDVTVTELDAGVRTAFDPPVDASFVDDAFVLMSKFEDSMKKKSQRVVDLFHDIDKDRSGSLTIRELEVALNDLCGPSARARAMAKMAAKREAQAAAQAKKLDKAAKEADVRRAKAEAAGAPRVLTRIDRLLKQKDFRVIDLMSSAGFDTSGDGCLDAAELQSALRSVGLKLTRKESQTLIDFLDTSGDGQLDAKELEDALRRHRRDFNSEGGANNGGRYTVIRPRPSQVGRASFIAKQAELAKAAASGKEEKEKKTYGYDPVALCFDHSWLKSLDTFLLRHTGPQDEHAKHARIRQLSQMSRNQTPGKPPII